MHSQQDGPALALSDIMHTLSPSQSPQPLPPAVPGEETQVDAPVVQPPQGEKHEREQHDAPRPASPDQELLGLADLENMRARLHELGLLNTDPANTSSRTSLERELTDIVIRLTSQVSTFPDPSQLAFQAQTISELTQQRNFLIKEKEEERRRWQAEREGWDRMAEALITQKRTADIAGRNEQTERQIARLQDDNKALQLKLAENNKRMLALQSELAHLRPLLMMEPLASPSNPAFSLPSVAGPSRSSLSTKRKSKKDQENNGEQDSSQPKEGDVEMATEDKSEPADVPAVSSATVPEPQPQLQSLPSAQSQPRSHYRTSVERELEPLYPVPRKARKAKPPAKPSAPPGPLLSDARSECLLLAARKIGRVRAGIIAGIVKKNEHEQPLEGQGEGTKRKSNDRKDRQKANDRTVSQVLPQSYPLHPVAGPSRLPANQGGQPRSPAKTPRKSRANAVTVHPHAVHPHMPRAHPAGIVYINSAVPVHMPGRPIQMPIAGPNGMPMLYPVAHGVWPMPSTPTPTRRQRKASTSAQGQKQTAESQSQGPSTPMDSLVSAARTLMVDEDYDGDGDGGKARSTTPGPSRGSPKSSRRNSATVAALESPVPKRRKLGSASNLSSLSTTSTPTHNKTGGRGKQTSGLSTLRVRSALDVLADQAAQEQERRPSADLDSTSRRTSVEPENRSKALRHGSTKSVPDVATVADRRDKGKGRAGPSDPVIQSTDRQVQSSSSEPNLLPSHARESPRAGSLRRPPSAPPGPLPLPPLRSGLSPRRRPEPGLVSYNAEDDVITEDEEEPPGGRNASSRTSRAVRALSAEPHPSRVAPRLAEDDEDVFGDPGSTRARSRVLAGLGSPRKISVIPIGRLSNEGSMDAPPGDEAPPPARNPSDTSAARQLGSDGAT